MVRVINGYLLPKKSKLTIFSFKLKKVFKDTPFLPISYSFGVFLLLFLSLFFGGGCQQQNKIINGAKAPDIVLPNSKGDTLRLSDVSAGKYVLIDFWASWWAPCRESHPELVRLYNTYKDTQFGNAKGLAIFSVSLDTKPAAWLQAAQNDSLPYTQTMVNDTLGFKSPYLSQYGFRVIPTSYLIDENGTVIGNNLSLKWLEYELKRRSGQIK